MKDTFTLGKGEDARTIKMSYGLLNELCKVVQGLEGAAELSVNNEIREEILIQILSTRNAQGEVTERYPVFNLTADIDEVVDLLDWAQGHIMDFLLKAAEKTQATAAPAVKRVEALKRSVAGGAS